MDLILEKKIRIISEIRQLDNIQILAKIEKLLTLSYSKTPKIDFVITDISNAEIQNLLMNNGSFDFLNAPEEDIYSDADLKLKY